MLTGFVRHLHYCPRAFLPMKAMPSLLLIANEGIEGDRYRNGEGFYSDRPEPGRQVTLMESEALDAIEREHGIVLAPAAHRRNITTEGVSLDSLVGRKFRIGSTVLEGTRPGTPCRHIEQITGLQVFEAMLNRSGLHARILVGGIVTVADAIEVI